MTDAEKLIKDHLEANPAIQELLADLFGYDTVPSGYTVLELENGDAIRWDLKPNQRAYQYWQRGKKVFVYTPWKDEDNWYYSWEWRQDEDYPRKLRKHRKRKDAKKRAYKLFDPKATWKD